jgi:MoxR-like ATPase
MEDQIAGSVIGAKETERGGLPRSPSYQRLLGNIQKVIYGKEESVRLAVVALFAQGHLLIEDIPGVGKTTLAQALARSVNCQFQRIQFTSDLLPSDILGVSIFNSAERSFEWKRGPVFTNILLADEINRTTPKTQSALLEVMNRGRVTLDGVTRPVDPPFMVIATQNPVEYHGTYPLPYSQLDRFLLRIRMGYPEADEEKRILRDGLTVLSVESLDPVMSKDEVLAVQDAVQKVHIEDSLLEYLTEIVGRTRVHPQVVQGASPRAALGLQRSARALAHLKGREYCVPDDVKEMAIPALAHRLVLRSRAQILEPGSSREDEVIREILESVPGPV